MCIFYLKKKWNASVKYVVIEKFLCDVIFKNCLAVSLIITFHHCYRSIKITNCYCAEAQKCLSYIVFSVKVPTKLLFWASIYNSDRKCKLSTSKFCDRLIAVAMK